MSKMTVPQTFREVIQLWPSRAALAEDIGREPAAVQKWHERDRIPSEHWQEVIEAAKVQGLVQVTSERLTAIAANRKD